MSAFFTKVKASRDAVDYLRSSGHAEPFLLADLPYLTDHTIYDAFVDFKKEPLEGYNPQYGRVIEICLREQRTSRFRYAYQKIANHKPVKSGGGFIDLSLEGKTTVVLEPQPAKQAHNGVGLFVQRLDGLTQEEIYALKYADFQSDIVVDVLRRTKVCRIDRRLSYALLKLYANYPEKGYNVPPDISECHGKIITSPDTTDKLMSVVVNARKADQPINWHDFITRVCETVVS